jgi:hypothetical protein
MRRPGAFKRTRKGPGQQEGSQDARTVTNPRDMPAMSPDEIAAIALSLPGTAESSHFGKRDFRAPKIFLSLPSPRTANLNFTPDQQLMFTGLYPEAFAALPNKWGQRGWTALHLDACEEATARKAIEAAWTNVVPARKRGAAK